MNDPRAAGSAGADAAIEQDSGRGDGSAKGADVTPAQAATCLPGPSLSGGSAGADPTDDLARENWRDAVSLIDHFIEKHRIECYHEGWGAKLDSYREAPGGADPPRQADELGHGSDGRLFHEAICPRCGLMLAYLVRDQVECRA